MVGLWLVFALLAVAGKTAYYALQKRYLEDDSSLFLGYITAFYGSIALVPVAGWQISTGSVALAPTDLLIIAGLGVIELVGLLVYLEALSLTDMSIASPLKKTKPVGVALLEPVLLAAPWSAPLIAGGILAGVGGYVVLMKSENLLAPFKRVTERGPALAILAAGIYVILSLGSRFGTTATSPWVFGSIIFTMMWVGYGIGLAFKGDFPSARTHVQPKFALVGTVGLFRSVTVWFAYSLATATLVSTVTQLTILTDVLVAGTLLGEGETKQRVVGACLILAGVVVVLTFA